VGSKLPNIIHDINGLLMDRVILIKGHPDSTNRM